MAQQPALHHDSSSSVASDSSGASDLNFECFTGAQTLAQFIQAIEGATGSQVLSLTSGLRTTLTIYYRHAAQQPYINLQIDQAVSSAEHDDEVQAQINSDANRDIGHRKVRPKKAHRAADNVTIYFTAFCQDNANYSVAWRP